MAVFATSTNPNRPSAGLPAATITTQNAPRMRLKSVSVFERTMLAYDRLVPGGSCGGAASRRRRASTWVRPVSLASVTLPSLEGLSLRAPRSGVIDHAILDCS